MQKASILDTVTHESVQMLPHGTIGGVYSISCTQKMLKISEAGWASPDYCV